MGNSALCDDVRLCPGSGRVDFSTEPFWFSLDAAEFEDTVRFVGGRYCCLWPALIFAKALSMVVRAFSTINGMR